MHPSVIIRTYSASDKEDILSLFRLNTPAYFSPEEETDLIHYLEHERELYFVVEWEHRVIGSGGINFANNGALGKISWDLLHPDFQQQGLGSRLLQHRIALLNEMSTVAAIRVRTSQLVNRFYEKNGFQTIQTIADYWAPGYDLVEMEYCPHEVP